MNNAAIICQTLFNLWTVWMCAILLARIRKLEQPHPKDAKHDSGLRKQINEY
jgi:hypothetical protein